MNLLGMGTAELLVIVVIMLIVAGPKRMIQWAYIVGRYVGQLRVMWRDVMKSVQQEFDASGVDIQLPKELPTRNEVYRLAKDAMKPIAEPMQNAMKEVEAEAKQLESGYKELDQTVKKDLNQSNGRITQPVLSKPMKAEQSEDDTKPGFGTWSGITKDQE